jgi:hypothetical protein
MLQKLSTVKFPLVAPYPLALVTYFYIGDKCQYSSHSVPSKPAYSPRPPSLNPDGTLLTIEQRQTHQWYFDEMKKTTACHHYRNPGHWKGECPLLLEAERQAMKKRSPRPPTTPPPVSALQASAPVDNDTHTVAFMATIHESHPQSEVWYVDSAASRHMTRHRYWFTTFTALPDFHWPIKGISSQPLHTTGIDNIVISCFINNIWKTAHLEQVLYVLGLENNLFSIMSAATKDIQSVCTNTGCIMSKHGIPVLQATLSGMMYELQIQVIPPNHTSHALIAASFRPSTNTEERQTIETWHNRLCHISYDAVKRLANSNQVDGIQLLPSSTSLDPFCEGCYKGKQHRIPFPINQTRTRATSPGDLLHANLMGPINPISVLIVY